MKRGWKFEWSASEPGVLANPLFNINIPEFQTLRLCGSTSSFFLLA